MKVTSDTTSFSLHVNSKSNKSYEVKFVIAISKIPEPPQKIAPLPPFPINAPLQANSNTPLPAPQICLIALTFFCLVKGE